jgi:hypothetical protein
MSVASSSFLLGAPLYVPAGHQGQQASDALDVQSLVVDQFADAADVVKVRVGEKPLTASPCGLDQAPLFIYPKRPRMNAQQLAGDSYGI